MRSKKSGRRLMALALSAVMLFPAPMSYAAEKRGDCPKTRII